MQRGDVQLCAIIWCLISALGLPLLGRGTLKHVMNVKLQWVKSGAINLLNVWQNDYSKAGWHRLCFCAMYWAGCV